VYVDDRGIFYTVDRFRGRLYAVKYAGLASATSIPSLDAIVAELESRVGDVPAAVSVRPEAFVDLAIVERLRASGYAESLDR
jgi:hypothetical protein